MFEMGITFFFWLKALQLAKTTDKVSNLVYLAPFLSLFLYTLFFMNPFIIQHQWDYYLLFQVSLCRTADQNQ